MHNSPIKRDFFAIPLLYYFFLTAYVYANSNLSGSVSLSYIENKSATQASTTKKDSFVQKYAIGYRDSVYSPKLLSFDLKTSLYLQNSEIETNNQKSSSDSRGENYNINLNFIKDTFMPFSISKGKNYTPYWSVINGESSFADQNTESTGLTGAFKLRFFDLTYSALESKSTKKDDISTTTIDNNDYSLSLYKAFEDKRINIQHSYNEGDYALDSTRSSNRYSQNNRADNSIINFGWDIRDTLKLSTYATYRNNKIIDKTGEIGATEVKSSTANIGMRWIPSKKYSASFNMNINKIESLESTSDSAMFSENLSYIATPEITLNQNILVFNTVTNSVSYDIYSAGVGSLYQKSLSSTLSLNAGVNFNKKVQLNDFADTNTSSKNIDYDTYGINAGITKKIENIDSTISANANYNDQISTSGDDNTRTSLNINLFTFLENNIKNNFSVNYAKERGFNFSGISDKLIKREIEVRTISDSLNYTTRIGFKGRLSTGAGVSQRETVSITNIGDIKTSNTYPYADISFNYTIWRTMVFISNAKVSQDSTYDMTNYTAFAAINYNYRKVQMTISTNYLRRDDSQTTTSEQSSINMLISRTF